MNNGDEMMRLLSQTIMRGASKDELSLFMAHAQRTGLDPLARQIYATWRRDRRRGTRVMQVVVSIDGLRALADRTGKYAGQLGPFWCGEDAVWSDVWLKPEPPRAAKVGILRSDFKEPLWGLATWDAYAPIVDGELPPMWAKMSAHMLAKCAEALGLRKAFPLDMSGLYTAEEMEQADVTDVVVEAQEMEQAEQAEQADVQIDPRSPFKMPEDASVEDANGGPGSVWRSGPGARLIPKLRALTGLSTPELLMLLEASDLSVDMAVEQIAEAVKQIAEAVKQERSE